ncbi:TetR/AcrR family transcriptional regulator [Haloechinothrix sp. LS1_15]|uniref:TetR/AcrR family transcriptional regulator n=1 Tax=Haloechinothrix sp. LS1_15 TaxID=2652248 RepID=UPI002944F57A|nr:TetR/AcrR family transcriptional regulator [Haloechinothrix sp. LS1_15]MDV6012923.1 TetR/AcrR family transcriptional regulator [Haloechinothrix sp. LS1_15]
MDRAEHGDRHTAHGGRTHRTQAERSAHTRTALLDATIDCLIELGYARTSLHEICARAGVTKGAQQHHFSTKAELMAAAVEHLTHRIGAEILDAAGTLPEGPALLERGIELLWQGFSGTLSAAVMELWVAARTDPELAEAIRPVDRALGRATLELFSSMAGEPPGTRPEALFWLTVNLIRGLALDAQIGGDPARREQLLAEWKRIVIEVYRHR